MRSGPNNASATFTFWSLHWECVFDSMKSGNFKQSNKDVSFAHRTIEVDSTSKRPLIFYIALITEMTLSAWRSPRSRFVGVQVENVTEVIATNIKIRALPFNITLFLAISYAYAWNASGEMKLNNRKNENWGRAWTKDNKVK